MGAGAEVGGWVGYLPLMIFAAIMALRLRNVQRARPVRLPLLWILPLIVSAAVILTLSAVPPSGPGWWALAGGLVSGAAIGMQRSRLMRLHVEGEGDCARVMMRQSPAALLLIVAVFVARRALLPGGNVTLHGPQTATALLATDAMLGFVLGLVVASRVVLWRRARSMAGAHRAQP